MLGRTAGFAERTVPALRRLRRIRMDRCGMAGVLHEGGCLKALKVACKASGF